MARAPGAQQKEGPYRADDGAGVGQEILHPHCVQDIIAPGIGVEIANAVPTRRQKNGAEKFVIPNGTQKHVLEFVRLVADRVGILLRDQKDAEAPQKEQHKAYHAQDDDNLGLLGGARHHVRQKRSADGCYGAGEVGNQAANGDVIIPVLPSGIKCSCQGVTPLPMRALERLASSSSAPNQKVRAPEPCTKFGMMVVASTRQT